MLISLADFKNYYSINSTTYDYRISQDIVYFSDLIRHQLGFDLTTSNASARFYGDPAGTRYIKTGLWSATDLLVTLEGTQLLTPNQDYKLEYPLGIPSTDGYPICGVTLLSSYALYSRNFIELSGSRGFSDSVPPAITMLLLEAIWYKLNKYLQQANLFNSGAGGLGGGDFSEKSQTWSVSIREATGDVNEDVFKLINGDFLGTKAGGVFTPYVQANYDLTKVT